MNSFFRLQSHYVAGRSGNDLCVLPLAVLQRVVSCAMRHSPLRLRLHLLMITITGTSQPLLRTTVRKMLNTKKNSATYSIHLRRVLRKWGHAKPATRTRMYQHQWTRSFAKCSTAYSRRGGAVARRRIGAVRSCVLAGVSAARTYKSTESG